MIVSTNHCESPAIAKMPRIDKTQRIKRIDAISLNGDGRSPTIQVITIRARISSNVTVCPLSVKNEISGIENPPAGINPSTHKTIKTISNATNILR